jgi:hypothetical protein
MKQVRYGILNGREEHLRLVLFGLDDRIDCVQARLVVLVRYIHATRS